MPYCRYCGSQVEESAKTCPVCGAAQFDKTPETVFCKWCGSVIDADCVVCPKCGKQVKELKVSSSPNNIYIQNSNVVHCGKEKNKWVALLLCFFLGIFGVHKFYEGKIFAGILYIFTLGLLGIGWFIDLIVILFKPNPYYV